jgi:hypothetical protein
MTDIDWFPDEPAVPDEARTTGTSALRYEDVSQDGRVALLGLPHAIGDVVWQKLLLRHAVARATRAGLIPVLSRFVIEGGEGPVSVRKPLSVDARYRLAHTVDGNGLVDRLLLEMWASLTAPRAHTHGGGDGATIFAGRVYAEHVFTRLFAPPAERKVLRLDFEGLPPVPPVRTVWRAPAALLEPPAAAARALDEALRPDEASVVFGLNHTDSNRHVNSLVYPRLFQDAALRRFGEHRRDTRLIARRLEIAYRKPCFAGERASIMLRAFELESGLCAVGAFVSDGAPLGRPHCTLTMTFVP